MRFITLLSAIASLCGLSASAVVAALGGGVLVERNQLGLGAPKLKRPPAGHMQKKRDAQQMYTFGGYSTNLTGDGNFQKLEEPIESNGHPHPWCQGFEGSNGYTEGQEPTIHYAHMDKAHDDSDVPQHICWFYNDFDCDPKKGAVGSSKLTHAYLTDKDKKNLSGDDSIENRNFPLMGTDRDHHRYEWVKSYGCMLYVDNPSSDGNSGGQGGQAGIVQGDTAGIEQPAAELDVGQTMRALAKRVSSWVGF